MGIVRLWPVALAVFIPGIVLLYLLKQKVKNQKISALNLWKEAYQNMNVSSPWEKFRNNILMYMQIAALILLIIALMSPYIAGSGSDYGNVIIMIDNSGSMNGVYSDGDSKLDIAKEQAKDFVNSNDGARYTVLSSGSTSVLEISGSFDKGDVTDAIENIEATDIAGSLESGVSMVQSLVAAWTDYKVIAFTDSSVNMQNINCEVVDLSVDGTNAAIQNLSHTISEDGMVEVMARVDNYGKSKFETEVNLYLGDKIFDIQKVETGAGESSTVYFKNIPAGKFQSILKSSTPYLMAEINSKDMLLNDNAAYDVLNGIDNQKILLVTEKNSFLEKALKLTGAESVDNVNPKDLGAIEQEEYTLTVYDGYLPDEIAEEGNFIFINPDISGDKLSGWQKDVFKYKKANKGCVVKTKKSKVTEYIENYTFSCMKALEFEVPNWAYGFFETDEKVSTGYLGNYDGRRIAVIGFDLHDTDFPLQTEFPIFMYNLLKQTMSSEILEKNDYYAGEAVSIQKKGKAAEAVVIDTDGTQKVFKLGNGNAVFSDTIYAGLYYVKEEDEDMYFTVAFPEEESDISKETVVTNDKSAKSEVSRKVTGRISKKMLIIPVLSLLVILLLAEWRVYRKHL